MSSQVLVLLSSADGEKTFPLSPGENLIGRSPRAEAHQHVINVEAYDSAARVSHQHALIICEEGTARIKDLGSLNGTIINRTEVLAENVVQALNSGDKILIGRLLFEYRNQ
jgi:pSer/pThr/pTyr-binding forkhead associated (FHA) protein